MPNHFLHSASLSTPLGEMLAVYSPKGLCLLDFPQGKHQDTTLAALQKQWQCPILEHPDPRLPLLQRALHEYFVQERRSFHDIEVDLSLGTAFQQSVWRVLQSIPYGKTVSYGEQARLLGNADAVRAVAAANGRNPVSIIVPCHRIIGSNGKLTGYAGGLWRKQALLSLENGQNHLWQTQN